MHDRQTTSGDSDVSPWGLLHSSDVLRFGLRDPRRSRRFLGNETHRDGSCRLIGRRCRRRCRRI